MKWHFEIGFLLLYDLSLIYNRIMGKKWGWGNPFAEEKQIEEVANKVGRILVTLIGCYSDSQSMHEMQKWSQNFVAHYETESRNRLENGSVCFMISLFFLHLDGHLPANDSFAPGKSL